MLSIIVPVYNEELSIVPFWEALQPVLSLTDMSFEIVFIDDGSTDTTAQMVRKLSLNQKEVRLIELAKNYGKEAAMTAGMDHSRGDILIPMDVDLQDPPDLIPLMIEKWREGYEVVLAKRKTRSGDGLLKRISASLFYSLLSALSQTTIPKNVGDYRLMDQSVVEALKEYREKNRFMKGIYADVGFSTTTIEYDRAPRLKGETKWNYFKLFRFAFQGIFAFSNFPLRLITGLGFLVSSGAIAYGIWVIIKTLHYGERVPGYPTMMVVMLFLGGIQLLSLGVIGEYIGMIFKEVKARPIYLIKRKRSENPTQGDSNP